MIRIRNSLKSFLEVQIALALHIRKCDVFLAMITFCKPESKVFRRTQEAILWGEILTSDISAVRSGMKPKVRARAPELSPEPGYLNFRFFSKLTSGLCFYISLRIK